MKNIFPLKQAMLIVISNDFTSDVSNHIRPSRKKFRLQELSSTVQQLQKLNEKNKYRESKPNLEG